MKKDIVITDELVISKIYQLRGHKLMLDVDLAELYQVDTKRLNEQVRRNISDFRRILCSNSLRMSGNV
jgi:hypothetical protein